MSKAPSQTQDKFIIRLPEGMRDRIKIAAEANGRSMNSEIVATLEHAYPEPRDTMHLVIEDIRRTLDDYEAETDPEQRLRLQTVVEGLASGTLTTVRDQEE